VTARLCLCGCGLPTRRAGTYRREHRVLCACGCGQRTATAYVSGHTPHENAPKGKVWCASCERYRTTRQMDTSRKRCRECAKNQRREYALKRKYKLTLAMYNLIKKFQGGTCAICQRATGKARALAVDHDHTCCSGDVTCGKCIRGLLCQPCNRMLGHLRDDPQAFERAAEYLRNPPVSQMTESTLTP
jgi:hypothetical protein